MMTADKAMILSPRDVGHIRRYVKRKYAELPAERHAEIIADAVKRIIYKQLPAFDEPLRRQLADELIRSVVLTGRRPVAASDVLQRVMQLDWRQDERLHAVQTWTADRLGCALTKDALTAVLDTSAGGETAWQQLSAAAEAYVPPAPDTGEPAGRTPLGELVPLFRPHPARKQRLALVVLALLLTAGMTAYGLASSTAPPAEVLIPPPIPESASHDYILTPTPASRVPGNELPVSLRYTAVDTDKLQQYLEAKQSMLRYEPYFDTLLKTAETFDIHPLLLFAITGQEQAFVPEDHEQAERIANNPFNVYHSWQDFNTTIEHSAAIAARTIIRLSRDKPEERDPVEWINREYAEDPNWHKGVNLLFGAMLRHVNSSE